MFDSVTIWKDLSGNNHDAVSSGDSRPQYVESGPGGQPSIYFEDRQKSMSFNNIPVMEYPYTLFMVVMLDKPTTNSIIFNFNSANIGFRDNGNQFSVAMKPNPAKRPFRLDGFKFSDTEVTNILTVEFKDSSSSVDFKVNGNIMTEASTTTNIWTESLNDIARMVNGYVSEVVIYDRILTPEEYISVYGYLESKYVISND